MLGANMQKALGSLQNTLLHQWEAYDVEQDEHSSKPLARRSANISARSINSGPPCSELFLAVLRAPWTFGSLAGTETFLVRDVEVR